MLPHQGKISGMTIAQTLWCRCKKDKATGKETYKPAGFPVDIVAKLKPIYNDLSKDDLLDNESINATIWDPVSKNHVCLTHHIKTSTLGKSLSF